MSLLERALAGLEAGALEVRLPDGSVRHFGSGDPVAMEIRSNRFFHRVATRGTSASGESYTAGEWEAPTTCRRSSRSCFEMPARRPRTPPCASQGS